MPGVQPHSSPLIRALLWAGGVLSLVLGAIGIVVPGLPTTPFVLLSGACFLRASPRAHAWLLRNSTFGSLLREWEAHRRIPRRAKRVALLSMAFTVSASLWFLSGHPWLQGLLAATALVGGLILARTPSRD